jgi:hypothetical protein
VDLAAAERCLHDRSKVAFAAAAEAGVPGRFCAFEHNGLLALLTTAPGLGFLNSISGLTEESLDALPDVIAVFAAANASAPSLATDEPTLALADGLRRLGFTAGQPRPVGTIDLLSLSAIPAEANDLHVTEAGTQDEELLFLDTLAAGYSPSPVLGRFLRAEHSAAGIRRFLAWQGDWPVAAAAFSVHRNAAVLGGAATVPAARRLGAQTALLNHRLIQAAVAGAHAAVVTAAPESASARNLARAGFKIRRRHGWN